MSPSQQTVEKEQQQQQQQKQQQQHHLSHRLYWGHRDIAFFILTKLFPELEHVPVPADC